MRCLIIHEQVCRRINQRSGSIATDGTDAIVHFSSNKKGNGEKCIQEPVGNNFII